MKRILLLLTFVSFDIIAISQPLKPVDSIQIRNVVMNFYNWYNKNEKKLNVFHLYQGIKTKDNPPYKINWKEVERYFAFIRSNVPQLGEEFIVNERKFFKECDSAFKAGPEDEIPYGFDYDRFTDSQEETQWFMEELKDSKHWDIVPKGATADVDILGSYLDNGKETETVVMCLIMKKEKSKWKIAKIGCEFDVSKETR